MIPNTNNKDSLYKIRLDKILNLDHPLCMLTKNIDWSEFDKEFTPMFCPNNGRPGIPTRMMVALHYLKYSEDLSDEEVVEKWVQNPYWQYFCGGEYFEHEFPIHPTSMTKWRKKIEKTGAIKLLEETIKTGFREKILKKKDIERVNVDTTVQEKNITYPTDAKLYYKAIEVLNRYASRNGIKVKQTYERVGKGHLIRQSRYAHARQMKRSKREIRKLKTCLGRLYRDIDRKLGEEKRNDPKWIKLSEILTRLFEQTKNSKNKIYSIHEPAVECISKGKAHKKYEFGNKVSLVSSSRRNFILGVMSFHGNPYDGHTLQESLEQASENCRGLGEILEAYLDQGYKGSGYEGTIKTHLVKRGLRKKKNPLRKWMKRRSGIEADIGHAKQENRLGRNYLSGEDGDDMNAILSGCGFNLRKLLRAFLRWILNWIFGAQKSIKIVRYA
jgi:transposase, IS5 family